MSFLDRIKGTSQTSAKLDSVPPSPFDDGSEPDNPMERTVRLGPDGAVADTSAPHSDTGSLGDTSIISEAAPSELAPEFSESRVGGPGDADMAPGAVLPFIGGMPLGQHQRI